MKGTIGDFTYYYYLQNKPRLTSHFSIADYEAQFSFTEKDWKQFQDLAKKDSIELSNIKVSDKKEMVTRIKASLARQIWHNEGFYEIMNIEDTSVLKAIEVLSK